MLYRTKVITVIIVVGLFGQAAEAASLCKPDVVGIDLIEGAYNPPAFMPPDVQIQYGWLLAAELDCAGLDQFARGASAADACVPLQGSAE